MQYNSIESGLEKLVTKLFSKKLQIKLKMFAYVKTTSYICFVMI